MKRETGRSFVPLFVTNFFGVFNDNFLKTLASFVVIGWIASKSGQSVFMGIAAGALVLPYILLSPLADRLTVLFPKVRLFRIVKLAELPIMLFALAGFWFCSAWAVVLSIVLIGVQSALYSPAKYALVRDIGGEGRISTGMGGMEAVSFAAVLAGTVAGSYVADLEATQPLVKAAVLLGVALVGIVSSFSLRADEAPNREIHAVGPLRYFRRACRMTRRYPGLNAVILTLSVFWWAAAMLQMGLLIYGKQVLGLDATHAGAILAMAAVGIVAGQVLAGFVDRKVSLLGATPVTGGLAAALLAVLFFVRLPPLAFAAVVAVLAFDLGFFKLPFDAEIQRRVKGPRLNTMLAYFNQVSFAFMLAASGVYALVSWAWGPRAFLAVLALALFVAPIWFLLRYRSVLLAAGHWALARRYAVEVTGDAAARVRDGALSATLFLPNHPAMVDPMLVMATLRRSDVRPLCDEAFLEGRGLAPRLLRTVGVIAVPDLRKHRTAAGAAVARGLTDVVVGALAAGQNVVFYPSGHIQTEADREEIGTRQLAYNVCKALPAEARVIAVRTRGLWGSIWSRKGLSHSPALGGVIVKSLLRWPLALLTGRRRAVTMCFEDVTDRVREWSALPRLDFNRRLEEWYNRS